MKNNIIMKSEVSIEDIGVDINLFPIGFIYRIGKLRYRKIEVIQNGIICRVKPFPSPIKGLLCLLSRTILKNWLKRRKIPYDGIHYCSEHYPSDKYSGCRRFSTDVMIEDKAENIIALSKEMKGICFDAPYNRNCEGENIYRAHNWDEVYRLIKGMAG